MPYIDKAYFDSYSDVEISTEEFNILEARAEDIINALTMDLQGWGFESLPASFKEKVKKATAIQIEFLYQNGGTEAFTSDSVTIGKFSYGGSKDNTLPISPYMQLILGNTGLMYRGI